MPSDAKVGPKHAATVPFIPFMPQAPQIPQLQSPPLKSDKEFSNKSSSQHKNKHTKISPENIPNSAWNKWTTVLVNIPGKVFALNALFIQPFENLGKLKTLIRNGKPC